MVRGNAVRGRRQRGPRGALVRRVAAQRAVRAARRAPLASVRARPTIRGRGVSSASINALRRFAFFPKRVTDKGAVGTAWWLETLQWVGVVAMKILTTLLTGDALERHLREHPLPSHIKQVTPFAAGSVPTGAIMRLAFGPEDFLGETDFIDSSVKPAVGHYRQARLEWVRIVIHPETSSPNRGGMVAAAIIPCNRDMLRDDFKNRETESYTMNELLKAPGVVYKTATTPTTLTYSPRPGEHGYEWLQFGCQDVATGILGAGGDACLYVDIGYHNLSSDSNDQTTQYAVAHALMDVTIEARVHLREYEDKVIVRTGPVALVDPSKALVSGYHGTYNVPLRDVVMHHGVMLHSDPRALERMAIQ